MDKHNVDRRKFLAAGAVAGVAAVGAGAFIGCGGKDGTDKGGDGKGGDAKETIRIVSSLPRTGSARGRRTPSSTASRWRSRSTSGEVGRSSRSSTRTGTTPPPPPASGTADREGATPSKAVADPDVMVFIGPYNSGAAKISMPDLNEAGLLQISPAVTWPGLTKKIKGVAPDEPEMYRPAKRVTFCRVCPTDDLQGPLAADFAKDELKVKKVYILDDKELYGEGIAEVVQAAVRGDRAGGGRARGHQHRGSIEFGGLMTKIKGLNPDLVYFGGTTQSKGGQIAKDMVKAGLTCPLIVPDGCYEQAFIDSGRRRQPEQPGATSPSAGWTRRN